MNRKLNITSIVLSILIGVALILTAVNPTVAYASAPAEKVTPPPTKTPEPTATPAPSETPVVTETPTHTEPGLTLQSDPTYIVPGGQVTFLYQISNLEKFTETTFLRFYIPSGFMPLNPAEGIYDESTGTFDIVVTAAEGKITWQADDTITTPPGIYAELIQDDKTLAEAKLELTAPVEYKIETTGGTAKSADGEVQVTFPQGALSETVMVKVTEPSFESLPIPSLSGSPFEITAVSDSSKAEVSQFSKPVEIQVQYDEDNLTVGEEELRIMWYDPSDGQWKPPLSQRVDTENNLLIAYTDHFTVFDVYNSNWQSAELPTLSYFQSPGYTGAASFSMPIKVPPGPGGFQPSLALSYNSQVVDSVTTYTQASWVGMGWSLDAGGYIERVGSGTLDETDDTYQLSANGMGGELWVGTDGRYHLAGENFYNINYYPQNDKWVIQDKSGTTYYFEETAGVTKIDNCEEPFTTENMTWRWMLSRVVNIYGQEMEFVYDHEGQVYTNRDPIEQCDVVFTVTNWIYPQVINYANDRYRIRFIRTDRHDYRPEWVTAAATGSYITFQKTLLSEIRVEQDANGDGTFETLIRKYQFNYCNSASCSIFPGYVWPSSQNYRTPTLTSVQEYGLGGTSSLPAFSFTYGDGMHLTYAQNGYGVISHSNTTIRTTPPPLTMPGMPTIMGTSSSTNLRIPMAAGRARGLSQLQER